MAEWTRAGTWTVPTASTSGVTDAMMEMETMLATIPAPVQAAMPSTVLPTSSSSARGDAGFQIVPQSAANVPIPASPTKDELKQQDEAETVEEAQLHGP